MADQAALFQELTPAEQKCVSAKISKLRNEGVEQDQAVARAIKECAPSAARPSSAFQGDDDAKKRRRNVTTYDAQQANDGTWTIFGVPIFSAHKRGDFEVDLAWLQKAFAQGVKRHEEGYFPPLHVRHHEPGEQVKAAGKLRFSKLGTIRHDGHDVPTIFADLVGVRPEIYAKIRAGELSYRSVELLDVDKPEIDSLALLDDEVPFFRFPLLKIGSEAERSQAFTQYVRAGPVLAYHARGNHGSTLFHYGQSTIKEKTMTTATPEAFADDAQLADMMGKMMQVLAAIAEKLEVGKADEDEEEEPEAPPPAMSAGPLEVGVPGAAATASAPNGAVAAAAAAGQFDALQAQVTALTAKLTNVQSEGRYEARSRDLIAKGFTEDHVKAYRAMAKDKGEVAAAAYAKALEDVGPADPPMGFAAGMGLTGTAALPDAPEVAVYGLKSPELLAEARSLASTHSRLRSTVPLAEYLEINMDPDEYVAKARRP